MRQVPQAFKWEHEQLSIMCGSENPFENGSKFIGLNFRTTVRNPNRFQVYAKNRMNLVNVCYSSHQNILPCCLLSEYATAYRLPWSRVLGKQRISVSHKIPHPFWNQKFNHQIHKNLQLITILVFSRYF